MSGAVLDPELVVTLRQVVREELGRAPSEIAALRADLRRFGDLLQERVDKPMGEWLTVEEAGRLLGMSTRAIYCEIERHPAGLLANASSRLGRRLRFSRSGLDSLLRARSRSLTMKVRVPSPGKGTERW